MNSELQLSKVFQNELSQNILVGFLLLIVSQYIQKESKIRSHTLIRFSEPESMIHFLLVFSFFFSTHQISYRTLSLMKFWKGWTGKVQMIESTYQTRAQV